MDAWLTNLIGSQGLVVTQVDCKSIQVRSDVCLGPRYRKQEAGESHINLINLSCSYIRLVVTWGSTVFIHGRVLLCYKQRWTWGICRKMMHLEAIMLSKSDTQAWTSCGLLYLEKLMEKKRGKKFCVLSMFLLLLSSFTPLWCEGSLCRTPISVDRLSPLLLLQAWSF